MAKDDFVYPEELTNEKARERYRKCHDTFKWENLPAGFQEVAGPFIGPFIGKRGPLPKKKTVKMAPWEAPIGKIGERYDDCIVRLVESLEAHVNKFLGEVEVNDG